ncbi:MAG TPA: hypothetical protein VHA52_06895 [Candidatus Babeliaceae bacterium]|nr:hypothetical protein [Candidatus Babeliaceae bacterium]
MKPFPKQEDTGAINLVKEYIRELVSHLILEVKEVSKNSIAKATGISAQMLSKFMSDKERQSALKLIQYFDHALEVYQVKVNRDDGSFSGGVVPPKTKPSSKYFIGGPEGYHWRIMVEIYDRRHRERKVGIRYLKINDLNEDVTFHVKIKNHEDYSGGKGLFMFGGHQLRFVFPVTEDREKMVYMRFIIGTKTAKPSLMSGIMVHNYIDKHSNSAYIIFAENISDDTRKYVPERMNFEKFKLLRPEIAKFFELHNTFIHCPREIYDLEDLREKNANRERENEEIEARRKAEANQPKESVKDFGPLKFKEEGDPDDFDD